MARVLDLGCGRNKLAGAIGADINPRTDADVLCNLSRPPYPFRDASFDEIRAVHVVEHVEDVIRFMEEAHRLLRPAGRLYLVTPHYSDSSSFRDPTHRWHLNSYSFDYFTDSNEFGYYSRARFRQLRLRITLARLWHGLGLEWLVNRSRAFRRLWEHYLCYLVRAKEMHFWLEALPAESGRPA